MGVLAATPAQARGSASLTLGPNSGAPNTPFTASFHVNASGGPGACLGGSVTFTFDATPVGSAGLDQTCTATATLAVPAAAGPGAHKIHATASGAPQNASASATFTVTAGAPTSTATTPGVPTTPTDNGSPSWSNSTTPYPGWTAPPFASQVIPTSTGPCDTSGAHAAAPDKAFLQIPAYSVGAHAPNNGSKAVTEPATGALPILSVGPAGMIPPQLGDGRHPYQYLELMEGIDPNVSPKLRLAAAAGEPFGCLHVESFGGPGSGYGYLSYALKDATVISVQDANPDGSPFQTAEPTVAAPSTPAPASTAKGKAPAPGSAVPTTPAPTAKFEKVVLGYSSLTWEYQEAAGGAQAPIHRGAGTIVPPPPPAPLSYSNLVFAFGGLVAAAVALMFAYHSRRRDLARRQRRRRATHAS
ncbi:type VI protein secretion system component Hcp [Catenulispora sp. GP43]|uniref:hypothetical protein n=1 Tax=Catenulispora sp. GP43 TaxID=3156263 RepID=UPI0035164E24